MAYKLIKHDAESYTMQHPDGTHFQVAKSMLRPEDHPAILHMADGGEVPDSPEAPAGPSPEGFGAGVLGQVAQMQAANPAALAAPEDTEAGMESVRQLLGKPSTVAPENRVQATTAQPQANEVDPLALPEALQAGGIQKQFEAESGQAKANQAATAANVEAQQKLAVQTEKLHTQYTQEQAQLFKDAATQKIDPNHYWATRSTGDKILATIGLFLGGVGGMGHGNVALDMINHSVDRDIEAQKANMGQKNNLFRMNMEKFHDQQQALLATKAQMLTLTAAKLENAAAIAGTPQAEARKMQLQAQLAQQSTTNHYQLAQLVAKDQLASGAGGQINPELLAKEDRDRIVNLPNGQQKLARSAADAEKASELIKTVQPLNSMLDEISKLGPSAMLPKGIPGSTRARAEALYGSVVPAYLKSEGFNRMNPEMKDMVEQSVGNADTFAGLFGRQERLRVTKDLLNKKLQEGLQQHLEGYRPVGQRPGVKVNQ